MEHEHHQHHARDPHDREVGSVGQQRARDDAQRGNQRDGRARGQPRIHPE